MALGLAFMVGEVFVPAYGSLGIGGIVAFVVGALMLIDTDIPGFGVPWTLIAVMAVVTAAFVIVVVRMAIRARRRPIVSGVSSLVGADGEMLDDARSSGWANIRGETWQVSTDAPLARGDKVRVVAVDGVQLRVAPARD
jgi:membrane-bound serine protease (ClpP class)